MTNLKRIGALSMALVLSIGLMAGCAADISGSNGSAESTAVNTSESAELAYRVILTDGLNVPVTRGVVVKFMQNGNQAGMQKPDENGVAEKTLPRGEYTVELQFTGEEYKYDASKLTLTGDAPELQIVLSNSLGDNKQSLFANGKDYEAYHVGIGSTQIPLNASDRSYFLFTPTESGLYEFSLIGSDAAIGYYGAPHFVQETNAAEVKDNKFTISVRPDMIGTGNTGTSAYVIGVDAGEGEAALCIQRIGDHEWSVADEPWIVYETTTTPSAYTLPAGSQLGEFDLTKTYTLVKDGNGLYHLDSESGPQVLVRLGKAATVKHLDPYETILEYTGVNCYFYDDNGEFVKKEDYLDCLMEYIACVDQETGLYPLTDDLMYIIQQSGEHNGWWNKDSNYIFLDDAGNALPDINEESAWLFMCCYIK